MESFFIFHRSLGSDDEEATVSERTEKLLFYSSSTGDDLEVQLERVSLCEAFVDFCRSFEAADSCEAIFLHDVQYALLECEPDLWAVACCKARLENLGEEELMELSHSKFATYLYRSPSVKAPTRTRSPVGRRKLFRKKESFVQTQGEATKAVRMQETSEPNARVLRRLLERIHRMFTICHGSMSSLLFGEHESFEKSIPGQIKQLRRVLRKTRLLQELVDDGDLTPNEKESILLERRLENEDLLAGLLAQSPADVLREKLAELLPLILAQIDFSRLHILCDADVLPFLSVDKATFLSTRVFADRLTSKFSHEIDSLAILSGNQVLWTSIPSLQLHTIHGLLEMIIFGRQVDEQQSPIDQEMTREAGFLEVGRKFLNIPDEEPMGMADLYFVPVFDSPKGRPKRMLIYAFEQVVLIVLTRALSENWTRDALVTFCGRLEQHLRSELVGSFKDEIPEKQTNPIDASSSTLVVQQEETAGESEDKEKPSSEISPLLPQLNLHTSTQGSENLCEKFLYLNETSSVVKISDAWLSNLPSSMPSLQTKENMFPTNHEIGLLFTSNLSIAINDTRNEFLNNLVDQMEITRFVRPNSRQQQPGCWLTALKSSSRQIFVVFDAKHSLEHVSQRFRALRESGFGSILF